MGIEADAARAVGQQEFGVMVLLFCKVGEGVDKGHGFEEVLKLIGLFNGEICAITVQLPTFGFGKACYDLCSA